AAGGASLGIGLHHGRIEVLQDGDSPRLRGEGLQMAAALAGCSDTRSIVTSQSFREALAASAPREAADLRPAGEMVDEELRKHTIFVFDAEAARQRTMRRRLLAGGGVVLLLAAGLGVRTAREQRALARRPGIIHLDIKPSGEVFVDGQSMGSTPPVLDLKLPPGPHSIEVRSGRFPPLRLDVQLQPGEEMQLRHVFAAPAAPARRARPRDKEREQPGLMDQLRDRLNKLF
ncbi:MAG TPA: PEGA domain-containing protein, partial [Ramlibacter sp.]